MARRVKEIAALGRIQVKEDARHDNDLLLETLLEEVQPVVDFLGQMAEVQPDVERRVRHMLHLEAEVLQAAQDVVTLGFEMGLQRFHLLEHVTGLEHGDGGFLEGDVGSTVKVRAAAADRLDEFFGADDPCYTPSREAEAFGQTVNQEDVVFVDVDDVVGGRDGGAVAVAGVVVAGVELVHDQSGTVPADVLDLSEFGVLNDLTSGIARVAREDD